MCQNFTFAANGVPQVRPMSAHRQMSSDAVDVVAQKHASVVRDPTDSTHGPSVVSDNAVEVHCLTQH